MKALAKVLVVALLTVGVNKAFADTQDRHISGFNAISIGGSFDTYLTQGGTESVKVEAPGDIINEIKTEVVDGELKIYQKSKGWGNWWNGSHKKVVIYISAKQLKAVSQSGSGDLFFKNGISSSSLVLHVSGSGNATGRVEAGELQCSVSGSGDMKLEGKASNAAITVSGSGTYSARDLVTNNVAVRVSGSGDATVNANDKIDASVSGSGDVRYTGAAKNVSTSKSGSGSVHRI
ncbi:head GIN domain-containing protein [Mucilaginibacter ginkgonis]|uniref:DUF2807 domain-containing protein n=1 Tax=Mucilaginibacter ginkgonis TaxID=2682091 RepID=A0A6I4IMQ6_9SPHI|nr:head GIN domain-containing protein [Mucilaginibacter ginkgonis]QQL49879.1 DUF2807 domain-containing protein [Mucilaginibacter ginkgonis]